MNMTCREMKRQVDLNISSTSAGCRVRVRRTAKDFDSGTVLSVVHGNIFYIDVGNDVGFSSILERVRLSNAAEPL